MKKYISFSGGVESTTMCLLFGNVADAIFADTGYEPAEIYERIDFVEKVVREFHGNDFKVIRVKKEQSLFDYILDSKFYPSPFARFCTRMFKIEPIDAFLSLQGECELMIGLNYDERDNRTGNHGLLSNVTYSYPLVELLFTRERCKSVLAALGLLPNFPAYMQRGGCIGCFFKSLKEYIAMALLNEAEFDIVMLLEEAIQDKRGKMFTIIPGISMRQIKAKAKACLFSAEEMYPRKQLETSCGVFCHR